MLKLYFSKGSSALAAHILLEEVLAHYVAVEVPIPEGAHRSPGFLELNPKGRIPALHTPEGVLTENPAILEHIATLHPAAACLPSNSFEQARCRELAAYLCATVHVAFAHLRRGSRWATTEPSLQDMQRKAAENLAECAGYLDRELSLSPWALGYGYTYCDPYVFLIARWMSAADLSLRDYPKLSAHHQAMLARPATQKAMQAHDLVWGN